MIRKKPFRNAKRLLLLCDTGIMSVPKRLFRSAEEAFRQRGKMLLTGVSGISR